MKNKVLSVMLSLTAVFFSLKSQADTLVAQYKASNVSGGISWNANIDTYRSWGGEEVSFLTVTYANTDENAICTNGSPRKIDIVFVVGNRSWRLPMYVDCDKMNSSQPNALIKISSLRDGPFWNKLFPANENGERWYALQVAAVAGNDWVSNYGQNFSLILK